MGKNYYNRQYHKDYRDKKRLTAMNIISNGNISCDSCRCNNINILEINHVHGGGREERRNNKYLNCIYFYNAIINGERDIHDLNILCKLCNTLHYMILKYNNIKYNIEWINC